MTPQSNFTLVAPIVPGHVAALRVVLERMNARLFAPNACLGMADPNNDVIPFGQFEKLHYARFLILDDQTLDDFERIGEPVPKYPLSLAFMGDCDGCADDLLADMARRAGNGLREIFSNCERFHSHTDLLAWMKQHRRPASAAYVNHIGRTVRQIRQEDALRTELAHFLKERSPAGDDPQATRNMLIKHVHEKKLIPPPAERTPVGWRVRNFFHFITLPAIVLVFLVALIGSVCVAATSAAGAAYPAGLVGCAWTLLAATLLGSIIFVVVLRSYETVEPEIVSRPTDEHTEKLAKDEEHGAVNQYSLLGGVKPTAFRRGMLIVNLWVIDWVARHLYNRGYLARIRTVHFARWVLIDSKRRMVFATSYDGSLESYNDDFINKGAFGLNFAFASGLGYPRTRWIFFEGARREQKFKYALRRYQLPTQVWYNAYPGLTVYDLERNARVREGIQRPTMSDADIRGWLADL